MRRRAGASYLAMRHTLRSGLYYARAGGRTLFLDVHANRYFSLTPAAEPDIERLENGGELAPDSPLVSAGLVVPSAAAFSPPARPTVPLASLLDNSLRPSRALTTCLLGHFARTRLSLALTPKRVLRRAMANGPCEGRAADTADLQRLSGAYLAAAQVLGAHDQCLAWSLALARLCRSRGGRACCIIGVSVRPFSAHAWVQSADHLINDRYDIVRNFTPILVL